MSHHLSPHLQNVIDSHLILILEDVMRSHDTLTEKKKTRDYNEPNKIVTGMLVMIEGLYTEHLQIYFLAMKKR